VKEFPDFIDAQHGGASMRLRRDLAGPAVIELMADPDHLLRHFDCVVI
jgi:hypothetical protein